MGEQWVGFLLGIPIGMIVMGVLLTALHNKYIDRGRGTKWWKL